MNYLEMYVLGSYGAGRNQLQVFNQFDPCCFAGDLHTTYEPIIAETVADLGFGEFYIFLDESQTAHEISTKAIEIILADMEN